MTICLPSKALYVVCINLHSHGETYTSLQCHGQAYVVAGTLAKGFLKIHDTIPV